MPTVALPAPAVPPRALQPLLAHVEQEEWGRRDSKISVGEEKCPGTLSYRYSYLSIGTGAQAGMRLPEGLPVEQVCPEVCVQRIVTCTHRASEIGINGM